MHKMSTEDAGKEAPAGQTPPKHAGPAYRHYSSLSGAVPEISSAFFRGAGTPLRPLGTLFCSDKVVVGSEEERFGALVGELRQGN
jgi:hypothetical protein